MDTSDDIVFEVPREEMAWDLFELLDTSGGFVDGSDGAWAVHATLHVDPGPTAQLLRRVESWVRERGLHAIRFHLDGRWYVLKSGPAAWAFEAA